MQASGDPPRLDGGLNGGLNGQTPADAVRGGWVERAPDGLRPYLSLSRFDRPAGFWLLGLPCWIGLALARTPTGFVGLDALYAALFAIGAIAMRGAGCTYNDIVDRDIDAKVARTALRPIPSGQLTTRQAAVWLVVQVMIGFGVWLALPAFAKWVALGSLPLVAAYPFMKRITWWPQAWLGLTFNWGALVAAAVAHGGLTIGGGLLYFGLALWTIGYDTIYALQDREDDALIGVKSTARLFGEKARTGVAACYIGSTLLVAAAGWMYAGVVGVLGAAPFAGHLLQQVLRLDARDTRVALTLFKANRDAGLLLAAGWGLVALLA